MGDSPVVTFKTDVLPILRTSCGLSASCHGQESGPGGQHYLGPKLSDPDPTAEQLAKIFDQSVGKTPVVNAGMNLITPGSRAQLLHVQARRDQMLEAGLRGVEQLRRAHAPRHHLPDGWRQARHHPPLDRPGAKND